MAPVGPPPGCQTCFFLCAIVSKAKVQRERGCRINVVRPRRPILIFVPETSLSAAPKGIRRRPRRAYAPSPTPRRRDGSATSGVRSTVETQPEEQIATIRRPTCALMEKLKITTGLPLDHSTDSLAPPEWEAFSSITSTNWPRSLPARRGGPADARQDAGPRRYVLGVVIFSHYAP